MTTEEKLDLYKQNWQRNYRDPRNVEYNKEDFIEYINDKLTKIYFWLRDGTHTQLDVTIMMAALIDECDFIKEDLNKNVKIYLHWFDVREHMITSEVYTVNPHKLSMGFLEYEEII